MYAIRPLGVSKELFRLFFNDESFFMQLKMSNYQLGEHDSYIDKDSSNSNHGKIDTSIILRSKLIITLIVNAFLTLIR